MHDIPKMRDVSVFTMVMNLIIGRYHWFIIDDFLGRRLGASSATEFFNGLLISFESSFDGFLRFFNSKVAVTCSPYLAFTF